MHILLTSDNVLCSAIELAILENRVGAFGISFLSSISLFVIYSMNIWFDRRHIEFLSYIGVLPLTKTSLNSPNKNRTYNVIYSAISQGCLLRATILLILDEFCQSKLLIPV